MGREHNANGQGCRCTPSSTNRNLTFENLTFLTLSQFVCAALSLARGRLKCDWTGRLGSLPVSVGVLALCAGNAHRLSEDC